MRDPIAIVEPAADAQQIAREILAAHIALQDCERALEAAERKATGLREQQAQRRLDLGRLLIAAKRGIKHGGWPPYLEKLGIPQQRASEWMRLAESAESPNDGDLTPAPTLHQAGIDKRPRLKVVREPAPRELAPQITAHRASRSGMNGAYAIMYAPSPTDPNPELLERQGMLLIEAGEELLRQYKRSLANPSAPTAPADTVKR